MVTPKNNLPPESQQWRRDMERRLAKLETSANNLQTAYKSSDTRLGSLTRSVNGLDSTINTLDSLVQFSDEGTKYSSVTLQYAWSGAYPFDPEVDQYVEVSIPPSDASEVTAVAWFGASMTYTQTAGPTNTAFGNISVGIEVVTPDDTKQLYWNSLDLWSSNTTYPKWSRISSPPMTVKLLPGKTYTFRTFRARDYTDSGGSRFDVTFTSYPIVVLLQFVQGA